MASASRLPSLDGWRALAIVLVLVSHFPYAEGGEFLFGQMPVLFAQGDFGVRIFLVLSGFLITYLLTIEWNKTGSISFFDFCIRRSIRILPVYFTYIFVLFSLQLLGLFTDTVSSWIGVLGSGLITNS